MKILFAVSEVAPFSKTGGLADVAAALPRALAAMGHDVRIVTPRYRGFAGSGERVASLRVASPLGPVGVDVVRVRLPGSSIPVYAVQDDRGWFDRDGLYQFQGRDFDDNLDRFAFFSRAVLDLPGAIDWTPDVVHCHDWQTALVPVYLQTRRRMNGSDASHPRTVLTVHNLGYQGTFPGEHFPATGLGWESFTPDGLEFYGRVNLLKGGLLAADVVTTVSPTYAREIQTEPYSHGLHGVLAARGTDLIGIINGIDVAEWNAARDPVLAASFSAAALDGKTACRDDLLRRLGLAPGPAPVLAMVTRLAYQKGVDLVVDLLPELLTLDLRVVILGTGDPAYEAALREWSAKAPERLAAVLRFDDALAHQVLAGADLFLMPSRYEPCGLSQLYAMRYGAVPVCHETGGLADTVVDYRPRSAREGRATGFLFRPCNADGLIRALQLALAVHCDRTAWRQLITAGMRADFGWERSAAEYVRVYRRALGRDRARHLTSP
ncbi:MAG: glycogen synthase GlgA [Nitrospirae bacterium]|nr:glycogen synthase GlgA [Nitrospirota bacterium]